MKNELYHYNGIFEELVSFDNGEDAIYINGSLLPQSSWIGTGSYTFTSGSITVSIRRVASVHGNVLLLKEGDNDNAFYVVCVSDGGGGEVDVENAAITFTQASSRTEINSGDTVKTLFGKIKKWLADLKAVAFTGSYEDLSNKPTIPSYSAGTNVQISNGVISATDTWLTNTKSRAGIVASSSGQANKVWKTDASGSPAWRDDANTWQPNTRVQAGYVPAEVSAPASSRIKFWGNRGDVVQSDPDWTEVNLNQYAISDADGNTYMGDITPAALTIDKSFVGLGNVDNTADENKHVNYANSAGSAPVPAWTRLQAEWSSGSVVVPKTAKIIFLRIYWKNNIVTDFYTGVFELTRDSVVHSYYYNDNYCGCIGFKFEATGNTNTITFKTDWMRQVNGSTTLTGMNAIGSVGVWTLS